MKKAVIFSPFWRQPDHVGNYRVERFIKSLVTAGYYVVLVRAGSRTADRQLQWGVELTVRDPLGLYRDVAEEGLPPKLRKPNRLRRHLAYLLFNPDPGILWARNAAKHVLVLEHAKKASLVLSSSPPESAHIGAANLARRLGARLVIDMRDGWLDEPMKPLLRDSSIQRWRERRKETAVLKQANKIFVNSAVWKSFLNNRLPFTRNKSVVLTNSYPPSGLIGGKRKNVRRADKPLRLLHAGRFTGSMLTRRVELLLSPLLRGIDKLGSSGVVTLLGKLESDDISEVETLRPLYAMLDWSIEVKPPIAREEMNELFEDADGLLLLAEKYAAIPVKFYEYLVAKKPVLAVTPKDSAVWSIGDRLPQVFLCDTEDESDAVILSFLMACTSDNLNYEIPDEFSESELSRRFIENISSN